MRLTVEDEPKIEAILKKYCVDHSLTEACNRNCDKDNSLYHCWACEAMANEIRLKFEKENRITREEMVCEELRKQADIDRLTSEIEKRMYVNRLQKNTLI